MKTLMFLLALASSAAAQSVTLAWNPSTDPTVTGYNVWYASLNDNVVPLSMQNVGNATQATITGLAADIYYCFVTSYNAAGTNSNSSNEVLFTVPNPPPPVVIPGPAMVAAEPKGTLTTAQGKWSFGTGYHANGWWPILLNGVQQDGGMAAGIVLFNGSSGFTR